MSDQNQIKLMDALCPKNPTDKSGGMEKHNLQVKESINVVKVEKSKPRGPKQANVYVDKKEDKKFCQLSLQIDKDSREQTKLMKDNHKDCSHQLWSKNVDNWYKGLATYSDPLYRTNSKKIEYRNIHDKVMDIQSHHKNIPTANIEFNFVFPNTRDKGDVNSEINPNSRSHKNVTCYAPERDSVNLITKESPNLSDMRSQVDDRVDEHVYKECDISLRKQYRQRVGNNLVLPTMSEINPKNVRRMTIGQPQLNFQNSSSKDPDNNVNIPQDIYVQKKRTDNIRPSRMDHELKSNCYNDFDNNLVKITVENNTTKVNQIHHLSVKNFDSSDEEEDIAGLSYPFAHFEQNQHVSNDIELTDVSCHNSQKNKLDSFSQYVSEQQILLQSLGKCEQTTDITTTHVCETEEMHKAPNVSDKVINNLNVNTESATAKECSKPLCKEENEMETHSNETSDNEDTTKSGRIILAELPNNAYFLTFPKPLVSSLRSDVNMPSVQILQIENNNNIKPVVSESNTKSNIVKKKKEKILLEHPVSSDKKKCALDKNVLKVLLFESLFKNNFSENLSGNPGVSAITDKEVGFPL